MMMMMMIKKSALSYTMYLTLNGDDFLNPYPANVENMVSS
jgi:hypothetical protein